MNPQERLENFLFLPDLKLTRIRTVTRSSAEYHLVKESEFEVCPKCATPSGATYDHRVIKVKDEPIRGKAVTLFITKRRLWCHECYKPFTEPVSGILKNGRLTQRFKRAVHNACLVYGSLSQVQKKMRCSSRTVYEAFYSQLEKKEKQHRYPLPSTLGIDEHSLRKPKYKATEYTTILVDHKNKKNLRSD
jgi:transposase